MYTNPFAFLVSNFGRSLDLIEQELRLLHTLTGGHDATGHHKLDLVRPVFELLADRLPHLVGAVYFHGTQRAMSMPPRDAHSSSANKEARPDEDASVESPFPSKVSVMVLAHDADACEAGSQGVHSVPTGPDSIIDR